jgi:hypothetical protein
MEESGYARLTETRNSYEEAVERRDELLSVGWEGTEIRENPMNGVLILASSLTRPRSPKNKS